MRLFFYIENLIAGIKKKRLESSSLFLNLIVFYYLSFSDIEGHTCEEIKITHSSARSQHWI
jgi:hypothetical protein